MADEWDEDMPGPDEDSPDVEDDPNEPAIYPDDWREDEEK